MKLHTVKNICPTGDINNDWQLATNWEQLCLEARLLMSNDLSEHIESFHASASPPCQGEELHWPIDSSQQLFSHEGGQASGKKRAGRSGKDDD